MSRSRAATPAGKRRSSGRRPSRSGSAAKAKPRVQTKRPAAKRSAPKRRTAVRAAPSRTRRRRPPARRPRARRAPARRRRSWSRPRPLRAARRLFTAASWRYRLGIVIVLAASLGAGYFLWLRDSSLVAVTDVEVVGVSSGDPAQIRAELDQGRASDRRPCTPTRPRSSRAAAAYPTIESVSVDPNFPHGMRIEVIERPPAMLAEADGRQVPVAGDGTLLTGLEVSRGRGASGARVRGAARRRDSRRRSRCSRR